MIYIDYTECLPKENQRFHGGSNYGKRVINLLLNDKKELSILIPNGYKLEKNNEQQFFDNPLVKIIQIDNVEEFCSNKDGDVLFIPLISTRRLKIIRKIKKNNPSLKVYVTIHGVRRICLKPDFIDCYYYSGIKYFYYPIYEFMQYYFVNLAYRLFFSKVIPLYDKIFTVSNYSMFKITQICKPQYIKWFYQGSINGKDYSLSESPRENFALFVSAGREEKNFLRTLIAFCRYIEENKSNIKLVVTGISSKKRELILRNKKINRVILREHVEINDYVETEELVRLYQVCKFVIYTSKEEGFGLPIIEACMHGTPVLAAYGSAMPEVLISAIDYVNPYSIEDIKKGIARYDSMKVDNMVKKIVRKRKSVIENVIASDIDLVEEFSDF